MAKVEGVKVSVTVQLPSAATGLGTVHVFAIMLKSAASAPATAGGLLKVSGKFPEFIRVTVMDGLVTPCVTEPKGRLIGRLTTGSPPVPVRETLCGLFAALSVNFNEADSAPPVDGVNTTPTAQLPVTGTGFATRQVLEAIAKSAAFAPVTAGALVKVSVALPMLISVAVPVPLGVPTGVTPPNGMLAGRFTTGAGAVPVPVRETLCEPGVALSAKPRAAVSAEVVDGLKVTVTVQLALVISGLAVEQVAPVIAKSASFVPVMAGLLVKMSDSVPTFIRITVMAVLVAPSGTGPNGTLPGSLTTGAGGGGGVDCPELPQAARVNSPAASATALGQHRITRARDLRCTFIESRPSRHSRG